MRHQITGQVIYVGPQLPQHGLSYSTIFRNGIHRSLYAVIDECPALAGLFVPIAEFATVRKELNFGLDRQMRGISGPHVEFYRAVQAWAAEKKKPQQPTTGVKLQHAQLRSI
jgi:hypothetical protein